MYNNSNYISNNRKYICEAGDYISYRTKENEWKQIIILNDTILSTISTLLCQECTEIYVKRYKECREFRK